MSKRNSKEAKAQRREKYMEKQKRFSNNCPKPDEYIRHYGYIPNDPYFRNSAIACNTADMKAAFRTKQQLLDYIKDEEVDELVCGRSGKAIIYISAFKTNDAWKLSSKRLDMTKEGSTKCLYLIRHTDKFCGVLGGPKVDMKEWKVWNPFYTELNTYMVQKEHIKDLPDIDPTDEEVILLGKRDEAVSPLTEMELDDYLASAKESNLRRFYEHNEDGLIIDEFPSPDGQTYYQPRKNDECWMRCTMFMPIKSLMNSIAVPKEEFWSGGNIYTSDFED